ncbi:MAG: hypothetical protein Q9198_007683 [Flavoplaca austrocitrina]
MTATPNPPAKTPMTMRAHEETYSDPLAGIQASPASTPPSKPPSPQRKGQTKDQPAAIAIPSLKKKVSFPETLTRGRGTSYTPPEDDKVVRFSTSLVRGESTSYNEGNFERDSSIKGRRTSNAYVDHASPMDFDAATASDDSFTDVVNPIRFIEGSKTEPRLHTSGFRPVHQRQRTWSFGPQDRSAGTSAAQEFSGSIRANFSDSHGGYMLDSRDDGASCAKFVSSKKRRNTPEQHTSFSRLGTSKQPGTASAPTYNRRGHKLRPDTIDVSVLHQSSRRSWPQPIFVLKDTRATTSRLSRPKPAFALRERSESHNKYPDLWPANCCQVIASPIRTEQPITLGR